MALKISEDINNAKLMEQKIIEEKKLKIEEEKNRKLEMVKNYKIQKEKENNEKINRYNEDIKKYKLKLDLYNKRQEKRSNYLRGLSTKEKIKYYLYETYIEDLYILSLILLIIFWILARNNISEWYYIIWIIILFVIKNTKNNEWIQNIGFVKTLSYFIGISFFIWWYNFFGTIFFWWFYYYIFWIIIFLPIIWNFFFNKAPQEPWEPILDN